MVLSWAKQRADASAPWALGSASPPSHSANGVNLCSHLTSIWVNKTKSVFVTHYCNCLVSSLKIHLSNIELTPPLFHSATVSILWILLELWRSFWDTSDLWDNQRESCEHFQSEIFFRNHYCDRKICFAFRTYPLMRSSFAKRRIAKSNLPLSGEFDFRTPLLLPHHPNCSWQDMWTASIY